MVTVFLSTNITASHSAAATYPVESDSACGRSDRSGCPCLANRLEQHQDQSCSGPKNRCRFQPPGTQRSESCRRSGPPGDCRSEASGEVEQRPEPSAYGWLLHGDVASELLLVESEMHRWKKGTLKSGSGRKVKSRKQAIAIGLSEARRDSYQ